MAAEGGEVVYFGGYKLPGSSVWYRVDVNSLEKTKVDGEAYVGKRKIKCSSTRGRPLFRWVYVKKKKKIHRVSLSPAAVLLYNFTGSCTLVGRDLYYFGKGPLPDTGRTSCSMFLAKHTTDHPDPSCWDVLYTKIGRVSPFQFVVFPVGRKLYVLGGVDSNSNLLGGIYDLDLGTWDNFTGDMYHINGDFVHGYYLAPYIALTEDKTQFLFYSLEMGSVLSFDITSRKISEDKYHSSLALRRISYGCSVHHDDSLPQGLEACDLSEVTSAACLGPGCLSQDTLYWFTSSLVLYGYHLEKKRWSRSSFLGDQFPTITVNVRTFPSLVALSGGKLFVIIYEGHGEVTVAPLMVVTEEDSLCVTVQSFHALSHGDKSLYPLATMSTVQG